MSRDKPLHPAHTTLLMPHEADRRRYFPLEGPEGLRLSWGLGPDGISYEDEINDTRVHFLIMGAMGSGKTTALHLLARSALVPKKSVGQIGPIRNDPSPIQNMFPLRFRALITDPKTENLPKIHGWGIPESALIIANPFDARCSAWDISTDLYDHARRDQFVKEIIEMDPLSLSEKTKSLKSGPWDQIANACLTPVMDALSEGGKTWDLRDLIQCCSNEHTLKQALNRTPDGRNALDQYIANPSTDIKGSVTVTLASTLDPMRITANLWYHAKTKFSVTKWAKDGGVIVLGFEDDAESNCRPTNYFIFLRAMKSVIKAGSTKTDLSWFFLDELNYMGKVGNLPKLLEIGRSAGARVVVTALGFVALEEAFEREADARRVIAQCPNQMYLAMNEDSDIEKAIKQLGRTWETDWTHTTTQSPNAGSRGETARMHEVPAVRYHRFQATQYPHKEFGIDAWFRTSQGPYNPQQHQKMGTAEIEYALRPYWHTIPRTVPAPSDHQLTIPWSASDFAHFGFDPPPTNEPEEILPEKKIESQHEAKSGPFRYTHISPKPQSKA